MLRTAVDERRHPRIVATHHRIPEGRPGNPLIVNASQGGACLWLGAPPPQSQRLTLHFESDGDNCTLHSRIVWSRPCAATTSPKNLARAVGWLAGVAFTQQKVDASIADIPRYILRTGNATVSFVSSHDSDIEDDPEQDQLEDAQKTIALDEKSVLGIKAATRDLLPVFAKHFSDVHVVLKRQQLEISASFRPPEDSRRREIEPPETQPQDPASAQTAPLSVAQQPIGTERSDNVGTRKISSSASRRRALAVLPVVAIATVFATYIGTHSNRQDAQPFSVAPNALHHVTPVWAEEVNQAFVNDWMQVKSVFALPDPTLQSAIRLLQHNDIYPPAHDLYDLSKYPTQAARAFTLMASHRATDGKELDLGKLKNDLEWRLIAGARFPDESPGGRYSSLQRELYNNVVVLGVVDMFYRRQNDPAVRELLSSIVRADAAQTDAN